MASPTKGFEFAYALDGGNQVPVIRDMPVNGTGAYAKGDLLVVGSNSYLAKAAAGVSEVTAVCMEARSSGSSGDKLKCAIIRKGQVWKCSADGASSAGVGNGYTKTINIVDENTIDATPATGGSLVLVDASELDDAGNVICYVTFSNTTF